MTEIGKVELDTEAYLKITQTMLELARQRDEARELAGIMRVQLVKSDVKVEELDSRLMGMPDWIYDHGVDS